MDQAPFTRSGFALIYDRVTLTSIRVASQIQLWGKCVQPGAYCLMQTSKIIVLKSSLLWKDCTVGEGFWPRKPHRLVQVKSYSTQDSSGTHLGSVLLHMLNIMEHFDFTDLNGLYVHRMVEAMKFGFSARWATSEDVSTPGAYFIRTRICDPEFASCNLFEISSKEYAAEAASNITDVGLYCYHFSEWD